EAAAAPGATVARRPPPAAERGRGHHADHDLVAVHQADQGGPYRDAAHVVHGRVDRVDDPAAWPGPGPAELLAEHGVPGPRPAQHGAQHLLDRVVRGGERR